MSGPGNRAYPWFDEKGKKTRVAAPQYIDYVMTFTQKTVSDENIFPTKYGNSFCPIFIDHSPRYFDNNCFFIFLQPMNFPLPSRV